MTARRPRAAALALLRPCRSARAPRRAGPPTGRHRVRRGRRDGRAAALERSAPRPPSSLAGTTLDGTRLDLASLRGQGRRPQRLGLVVRAVPRGGRVRCSARTTRLNGRAWRSSVIDARDKDPATTRSPTMQPLRRDLPVGLRRRPELLLSLRGTLPPAAIPSTLVLDGEGRIAARTDRPPSTTSRAARALIDPVRRRAGLIMTAVETVATGLAAAGRSRSRSPPGSCRSSRRACCRWCRATSPTSPA